jgi:hypothetical protein
MTQNLLESSSILILQYLRANLSIKTWLRKLQKIRVKLSCRTGCLGSTLWYRECNSANLLKSALESTPVEEGIEAKLATRRFGMNAITTIGGSSKVGTVLHICHMLWWENQAFISQIDHHWIYPKNRARGVTLGERLFSNKSNFQRRMTPKGF